MERIDLRPDVVKRLALGLCLLAAWGTNATEAHAVIGVSKTIAVRIFVDEEEPRREEVWRETLGRRLDRASVILSKYGSVRFAVTHFSRWQSDNATVDFPSSLKEFERETDARPAELAIGFSSQYHLRRGRSNLGGTRGPLRRHILIREGAPNTREVERLEVLVHELAHYLGAAHSGRLDSVMRPVLGDSRSRVQGFRIQLDPQNAKIVQLLSGEMASRHIRSVHQLSLDAKMGIRQQYAALAKSFPDDEVAGKYVVLMDRSIKASVAQRQRRKKQSAKARPKPIAAKRPALPPP